VPEHMYYFVILDYNLIQHVSRLKGSGLSRLRMSSHRLKVETGRWQKSTAFPFSKRKCTLC